ncbi:MAG: mechanosensitive ion channel family protein [Candidatus Eisenbacteria bacterium]
MFRSMRPMLVVLTLAYGIALSATAQGANLKGSPIAARPDSVLSDSLAAGLIHPDSATEALTSIPAPAPAETSITTPPRSAPVFLGGREIFRVRVGRDGLDPAGRAAAIRRRLNQAVTDKRASPDSVRLIADPAGIQVRLGPHFLWLITPGDAPSHNASELAAKLSQLPQAIRDGIARERAGRRPARVLISSAFALALTLVALGLFRLLFIGSRSWRQWLVRTLGQKHLATRHHNFEMFSKAQVAGVLAGVLARLDIVVGAMLLYGYFTALFSLFSWTQGWSSLLLKTAVAQAQTILNNIWFGLPGLFSIALILLLFRWLTGLASRFFDSIADGSLVLKSFHPELARPSKRIVEILLWMIAIMIAYPYVPGSGSKAVQGVSLIFGLVLSLGSTGFIGNMIAGIVLTYSRAFKVGDRVRIADHVGDVVSLGFFATKLRSIRNEEVTIPNGQVTGTAVINYTRLAEDPGLILYTQVTIGYDVEWRTVQQLLIEAALRVDGVENAPLPWVFQRSLDDSYVSYELNCVTHQSHPQLRLYSDLHAEIQDAFSRAGVEILSPGYHAIRDANAQVLPKEPVGPREEPWGFRVRRE